MYRLTRALTVVLLVTAAGCALPLDAGCINETRNLSLEGALQPTDSTMTSSGTALISLHEARNYRTKHTSDEDFLWSVRASGIDRSAVSAVHVHERDTNRLLFQLPLENTNAPADVITQTFTRRPHNGAIAQWSDVYELLGSGPRLSRCACRRIRRSRDARQSGATERQLARLHPRELLLTASRCAFPVSRLSPSCSRVR